MSVETLEERPAQEPPPLEEAQSRLTPAAYAAIAAAVLLAADRPDLPDLPWERAAELLGVPAAGAVLAVARAASGGDADAAAAGARDGAQRLVQMAQGAARRALADPPAPGDLAALRSDPRPVLERWANAPLAARAAANTAMNSAATAAAMSAGAHTHKTWVSMNDNRVRPTHNVLDSHAWPEHTVPIREPFVSPSGALLMFPGDPSAPLDETANCFLPGTMVRAPDAGAVMRRYYRGGVVRVRTASGRDLAGTPNHPVLTPKGWVPLGLLVPGDDLVRAASVEDVPPGVDPHPYGEPTAIGEAFRAGLLAAQRVGRAAVDFHGEGVICEVDVVPAAGDLVLQAEPPLREHGGEFHLIGAGPAVDTAPDGGGPGGPLLLRGRTAAHGGVGGLREAGPLLRGGARHADPHGLAAVARSHARFDEAVAYGTPRDAETFREELLGLAGQVLLDEVVDVQREPFSGHVFDLQTASGMFVAGDMIVHNCRCHLRFTTPKGGTPYGQEADLATNPPQMHGLR